MFKAKVDTSPKLNGSRSRQVKFWTSLNYHELGHLLGDVDRLRFARLRLRLLEFTPLLELFARGMTYEGEVTTEYLVSEHAFLVSSGTSQAPHMDSSKHLFFNSMLHFYQRHDIYSTYILDYAQTPEIKRHYRKEEEMFQAYASHLPALLDQDTIKVIRARIKRGSLWFFPSSSIHGGSGAQLPPQPNRRRQDPRRIVLYSAMLPVATYYSFDAFTTSPYYHILLRDVCAKYNASRIFIAEERRKIVDDEVTEITAKMPRVVKVLKQWVRYSPLPIVFNPNSISSAIAQALIDTK